MMKSVFIITIDTEGDNAWETPMQTDTHNLRFLPRFQALCERFGFKPTYLANYEAVSDSYFQAFARSLVNRGAAEIGLHLHAWNSPPLTGLEKWDANPIYITELPTDIMREKMLFMTDLLANVFGQKPVSHRAGRWALDERLVEILIEQGYLVDCTVTPGVSWRPYKGLPDGQGGVTYEGFRISPFQLDPRDLKAIGESPLLEVPVTIRPNYGLRLRQVHRVVKGSVLAWPLHKFFGNPHSWLRPNGENIEEMKSVVEWAFRNRMPALEFVLHSSELMPGGSPYFRTAQDIEQLYDHLTQLFGFIRDKGVEGATLADFRRNWGTNLDTSGHVQATAQLQ